MREILFKGKMLHNNEWIEGGLVQRDGKAYIVGVPKRLMIDGIEVDPETVCQYTGIKDYDGNKVWENDVVDISEYVRKMFDVSGGKVKYIGGAFVVGDGDGLKNSLMCLVDVYYQLRGRVIGNVFDNSQPIKEKF